MKKYIRNIMATCLAVFAFTSCSDVNIPDSVEAPKATDVEAQVDGRNVTLNWTLPADEDKVGVDVYRNSKLLESLGLVNTYSVTRQPTRTDLYYTVKVKYGDGRVSEGTSVKVYIDQEPPKVGMLIAANSEAELEDDDEIAAVNWFMQTYGDKGQVLTAADAAKINPSDYPMLWIQIDRVGIGKGMNNLPACINSGSLLAKLTEYVKDGGNLLLTKHATQLVAGLGRIENKFDVTIFSDGNGGEGTDIWTTNAVIGSGCSPAYDHRGHSIFSGLEVMPKGVQYDHDSYPLEGPGMREDHNCMWDLNAYSLPTLAPDAKNVVDAFERITNSTVLATWGHVSDYCCAGIIEFNPTDEYKGRIIAIGLSAYEFNQNSGVNQYQKNTETLTKNSIDYLAE